MNHLPTLETARLILRPFQMDDARRVQELAGAPEVAATTLNIAHPYEDGMAEKWIASLAHHFYQGQGVTLAMTLKTDATLIGTISTRATPKHQRAEIGYWVGVPYWGQGYCTEAATALIEYSFNTLNYHKITASHMASNPASGRVMQKAGMRQEGVLVDHTLKHEQYHSVVVYGLVNTGKP